MVKAQIYVVDDEQLIRKGLKLLLNREQDLQVCGESESGAEAVKRIPALRPDLAIVDLTLKEENGLEVTRQLRQKYPPLKILIFSMHSEVSMIQAAFKAGADGYVTKDEGTEKLIEAIHALLEGKLYFPKKICRESAHRLCRLETRQPVHLSPNAVPTLRK